MNKLVNLTVLLIFLNSSTFAKECIMSQLNKYDNKKSVNIQKVKNRYLNSKQLYIDFYGNKVEEKIFPDNEYFVFISIPNTPYSVEKRFNNRGKIYYFTKLFKGMSFGDTKSYDKNNNKLLKINNLDQEYNFDLCGVIKVMNKKYSRNIENKNFLFSIERWNDTEKYKKLIYEVVVRNPDYTLTEYIIDGLTGETLNIAPRTEYLN